MFGKSKELFIFIVKEISILLIYNFLNSTFFAGKFLKF